MMITGVKFIDEKGGGPGAAEDRQPFEFGLR